MTDNKKIIWENIEVDVASIEEDEEFLTFKDVVLVREGVQQYSDGRALKDAAELEKYAPYANGWAVAGAHPPEKILTRVDDIAGETRNSHFVKDLLDPKTNRRNIRGVKADLVINKSRIDAQMLEDLKSGKKNDVSVGFLFDGDPTPGLWNGEAYDYVQRNMFPNHLAFGIERGRCPSPYCGLAADEVTAIKDEVFIIRAKDGTERRYRLMEDTPEVAVDPEVTEKHIRIPVADCEVTATITLSEKDGIKALYCGKVKKIRTYLFERDKGWTMAKAKAWVKAHGDEAVVDQLVIDQPRTPAERAKAHFGISDEDWEKLTPEEKQAYIDKLPPRGTAGDSWKEKFPEAYAELSEEGKKLIDKEVKVPDPVEPVEPVEPVVEPVEPVEPAEPVEPVEPVEPAEPVEEKPDSKTEIERTDKLLEITNSLAES